MNRRGQVIGINTALIPTAHGIGFAIPISTARPVIRELIARGRIVRPTLGIVAVSVTPQVAVLNVRAAPILAVTAVVVAAPVGASPGAAPAAALEVVIRGDRLEPRVLQATIADRVIFLNRTGHLVHVEFLGSRSGHHVFQVPGQIWAVFHRAGPHLYVVHLSPDERTGLRGVVEVGHVSEPFPDLPVCGGVTVEGICLEP